MGLAIEQKANQLLNENILTVYLITSSEWLSE